MSGTSVFFDRLVTFVVGVALIAGAVIVIGWKYDLFNWLPEAVDSGPALDVTEYGWWPWALAAAALILLLLGLRWLFGHLPSRRVTELRLPGSGAEGRLEVDAGSAVSAACASLQSRHDIRSAKGDVRRDRGQLVIDIRATLEPRCDLAEVATAIDETTAALTQSLERPDLYCRVRLDVGSRGRSKAARLH
ncbi:MAG: hypothetical protein M3386_03870 [Actinomycetota bacterium]|nr:hypothetical protein [Actinomycetota bacterium]